MGAEEFFQNESSAFLFVLGALFGVLIGVSGAVGWCFNGTFNVVMRDV